MAVWYDLTITGWPSQVLGRLRRKIGALSRHHAFHQKVGITNDPDRRWGQAYKRNGWREMRVIYKSDAYSHVCKLERDLIDAFDSGLTRSLGYFYNRCGGGGGRVPVFGPYYLYVVNASRGARVRH